MSRIRRDTPPTLSRHEQLRPKSPAEALEPSRAPQRPKGSKQRKEGRGISGFMRLVSGLMTLALIVMIGIGSIGLLIAHVYQRPGPLTSAQSVVVPKGASTNSIADRLERQGVISSRWVFMVNFIAQKYFGGKEMTLKHGEYLFKPGASIQTVLSTIASGRSVSYRVTIPEGLTSQQIVERLNREELLTGSIAQIPIEGSLLPETYSFEKGSTREEIIRRMQGKLVEVVEQAWERRNPDVPLETPQDALILASVIEKETGRADERERIAGVFVNRLRKRMRLQSDPTILYGIYGGGVKWGKPILRSEIATKNDHNTYQMHGLPKTPICNPGRAAIEAALNPAETKDIYFVADGRGGHIFSETLKQHNTAVREWRKAEREMRARQAKEREAKASTTATPEKTAANPFRTVAPGEDQPTPPADPRPVVINKPAANPIRTVPAAETSGTPAVSGAQASSIPLPVRKPKP